MEQIFAHHSAVNPQQAKVCFQQQAPARGEVAAKYPETQPAAEVRQDARSAPTKLKSSALFRAAYPREQTHHLQIYVPIEAQPLRAFALPPTLFPKGCIGKPSHAFSRPCPRSGEDQPPDGARLVKRALWSL